MNEKKTLLFFSRIFFETYKYNIKLRSLKNIPFSPIVFSSFYYFNIKKEEEEERNRKKNFIRMKLIKLYFHFFLLLHA